MKKIRYILLGFCSLLLLNACDKDEPTVVVEYDPTPYQLEYGNLPEPSIAPDNPLTIAGVQLGRMLFYEQEMSKDGTQSCATCHRLPDGFSDTTRFSIGVEGLPGKRQAMPVFNMAWHSNQFFWDGRANLLRDQALLPIQDPLEMNETLENVVAKLEASQNYKDQFKRAFGSEEINSLKISLALEQFMNSIVSHDSKYDRFLAGLETLTDSEERGRLLFETEYSQFFPEQSGADCAHCHGGANFENDQYMNNGLDSPANMLDLGRENVTMDPNDRGKFKVPSLRNVAVTPPYMHDGRFRTLRQVIEHYDHGIKNSPTVDPTVQNTIATGLRLSEQDKTDLINFLHTLTDDTFLNREEYKSPF